MTPAQWEADRPRRQLAMLAVAFDELGLDMAELQAMPPAEALWAIARSYEEQGITKAELDGWVAQCDPPHPVEWSPEECVRAKLRAALKKPISVPKALAIAGGVGFVGTYLLARYVGR